MLLSFSLLAVLILKLEASALCLKLDAVLLSLDDLDESAFKVSVLKSPSGYIRLNMVSDLSVHNFLSFYTFSIDFSL